MYASFDKPINISLIITLKKLKTFTTQIRYGRMYEVPNQFFQLPSEQTFLREKKNICLGTGYKQGGSLLSYNISSALKA